MSHSRICVDAGLVVRRVIFPDDLPVQRLWDTWEHEGASLVAPALIFYEVTNVLHRYQRQGWLSKETVGLALAAALSLPVDLIEDMDLHLQAKAAAEKYDLPATYDAHYLALAERLGIELYSADIRLFNALQPFGISWLKQVGDKPSNRP
jgi:predicted nucleic acid-binding protein